MSDRLTDLDGNPVGSNDWRAQNGYPPAGQTQMPGQAGANPNALWGGSLRTGQTDSTQFWQGQAAPASWQQQIGPAAQSQYASGLNGLATGAQNGLLGQLQAQAMGQGPSLATMAANQQAANASRQQAAQAAGNRGNPMASYFAAQNMGAIGGQAANAAAMGRAQEQLNAQQALAGLAGQMQGQGLQNAGQQMQNQQFNAGQSNQLALQQAQLNQQGTQAYNDMMAGQVNAYNANQYALAQQQQKSDEEMRNNLVSGLTGAAGQVLGGLAGL